jgi:hypothetical protein
LEAVRKKDWEWLGVLLGVADIELGKLVAAWPSLPKAMREALVTITSR